MDKKKWLAVILCLLVVVGYVVFNSSKKKVTTPTATVKRSTIVEEAEAVGFIKPRHSVTIKSQIDGIVEEVYCYEGEYVKSGTPLLKIKPAPSPDVYAAAYQQVMNAKATQIAAQKNLERFKSANRANIIGKNYGDYINAQQNYDATNSQLLLAQQKLALLEQGNITVAGKSVANIVSSPIDGYVINKVVSVGDPVISLSSAQSATPLFIIADMNDLMFQGTVDEVDAGKIVSGMTAKITLGQLANESNIAGVLTRVAMQSENENVSNTKVSSTVSATSPFSVGFKVEIADLQFPPNLILRSGSSATAMIKVKSVTNVLSLPVRVIQFKGKDTFVLLPPAKDNASKQKPVKQPIEIGISDGVTVEVKSGLKEGDKVLDKQESEE